MKLNDFYNTYKYINDGIGKNTSVLDVNKKQLLVGINVEFEHTRDINMAASIAIDHLTEKPEYYTILLQSGLVDEKKAIYLGKKLLNIDIVNNKLEDDQLTDILLGFTPHKLGGQLPIH